MTGSHHRGLSNDLKLHAATAATATKDIGACLLFHDSNVQYQIDAFLCNRLWYRRQLSFNAIVSRYDVLSAGPNVVRLKSLVACSMTTVTMRVPAQVSNADSEDIASLGHFVGFTYEELVANREGEVTSDQLYPLITPTVIAAIMLMVTIRLATWPTGDRSEAPARPSWLSPQLLRWLLVLGGLGFAAWVGLNPVRDLVGRTPAVVEGSIDAVEGGAGAKGERSFVKIGGLSLIAKRTPRWVQDKLRPGRYRVYYLPHTKNLLSMEPVEDVGRDDGGSDSQ